MENPPNYLGREHLLLAAGPGLVDVRLVLELLGQVLQPGIMIRSGLARKFILSKKAEKKT